MTTTAEDSEVAKLVEFVINNREHGAFFDLTTSGVVAHLYHYMTTDNHVLYVLKDGGKIVAVGTAKQLPDKKTCYIDNVIATKRVYLAGLLKMLREDFPTTEEIVFYRHRDTENLHTLGRLNTLSKRF